MGEGHLSEDIFIALCLLACDLAVVRMEGGSDTDLELLESLVSQKPPAKSEEGEEEKMDDDGGKAPEESPAPQVANGSSRDTPVKRRNKKRDRTTYSEDESESSSDSEPEQQKEKEEHKESDVTVKDNVPSEGVCWGGGGGLCIVGVAC